jgi:hypothetical protein
MNNSSNTTDLRPSANPLEQLNIRANINRDHQDHQEARLRLLRHRFHMTPPVASVVADLVYGGAR